jgi:hypothetical protein
MADNIIPTCKYGHGNLERQNAHSKEGLFFKVDTFPPLPSIDSTGAFIPAIVVYSFAIYKCPKCSYMEFHDVV